MRRIVSDLSEVDQFIFDAELRHIETLKRLIEEVEARIANESAEIEDVKLLMGIPGVDFSTALHERDRELQQVLKRKQADQLVGLGTKGSPEWRYKLQRQNNKRRFT